MFFYFDFEYRDNTKPDTTDLRHSIPADVTAEAAEESESIKGILADRDSMEQLSVDDL